MLTDLLSGDMARAALGGGNGKGLFLVLLATATIAVPYFWKHKVAPLAFIVPLLFTFTGFWPLYKQHRAQQEAIDAMGEFGQMMGQMGEQMGANTGPFDSLGIGAWLLFATVIFLAFQGLDALPRARLSRRYFIVGIVNSAPREPSGQRAVTVLSRV
jgi:hypothetical protein